MRAERHGLPSDVADGHGISVAGLPPLRSLRHRHRQDGYAVTERSDLFVVLAVVLFELVYPPGDICDLGQPLPELLELRRVVAHRDREAVGEEPANGEQHCSDDASRRAVGRSELK